MSAGTILEACEATGVYWKPVWHILFSSLLEFLSSDTSS